MNDSIIDQNDGSIMKCLRCEHRWFSRVKDPKRCPRCKSPYWKQPKTRINIEATSTNRTMNLPLHHNVIFKGDVEPIVNLPSKLYSPLKTRLLTAMRDKLPIKFATKDGEITEIV
jgi:hypothetical protein